MFVPNTTVAFAFCVMDDSAHVFNSIVYNKDIITTLRVCRVAVLMNALESNRAKKKWSVQKQ